MNETRCGKCLGHTHSTHADGTTEHPTRADADTANRADGITTYEGGLPGETVTEWGDVTLPQPATLTYRSDLRPGDVIQSSHYGKCAVYAASTRGSVGTSPGTTHLALQKVTGGRADLTESYPADSLVPLYTASTETRSTLQDAARIIRTLISHHEARITNKEAGLHPDYQSRQTIARLAAEQHGMKLALEQILANQ